jgi:hypothetical protein
MPISQSPVFAILLLLGVLLMLSESALAQDDGGAQININCGDCDTTDSTIAQDASDTFGGQWGDTVVVRNINTGQTSVYSVDINGSVQRTSTVNGSTIPLPWAGGGSGYGGSLPPMQTGNFSSSGNLMGYNPSETPLCLSAFPCTSDTAPGGP